MFWSTFNKLQLSPDQLRPYDGCLYEFVGDQVEVRGHVKLRTTFTDDTTSRTFNIRYLIVNAPSFYNILLGRPALNRIGAVASTRHMKMKMPSLKGAVITIKSDQKAAKKCYENSLKTKRGCAPSPANLKGEKGSPELRWPGKGDPNLQGRCWRGRSGERSSSSTSL